QGIYILLDKTQILSVSAEAKKHLYRGLYRYCRAGNVCQVAIVAPHPFVRILARGKYLFRKGANYTFHRTYTGALARIKADLHGQNSFQLQKEDLLKKARKASNKELFHMYKQLLEENLNIKAHQQQR